MKVAVSGARGFVGQRLVQVLAETGAHPIPLVRSRPSSGETAIGDLTAEGAIDLPSVDAIVHLASRVHVMDERADNPLDEYRRVNVHGTGRLLQAAHAAGARRFVFVSTIKVLGEETPPGQPFTQSSLPDPKDPYSISKLEAEELVIDYCENHGMEWSIVRPVLVYGPGVKGNFAQLLAVSQKRWPFPFASVRNARSLIFNDNLCAFLHEAVHRPELAKRRVNLADEQPASTPQLICSLANAMGKQPTLLPVPSAFLEFAATLAGRGETMRRLTRSLQVDSTDLFREMRWQPPVPWEAALKETAADAFRNN